MNKKEISEKSEKENPRDNLGPVEKAIYKMLIFTGLLRH